MLRALHVLLSIVALAATADAEMYQASVFDPVEAGDTWTYQVNGQPFLTATVHSVPVLVSGVPTLAVQHSGIQTHTSYVTNDALGARSHASFQPDVIVSGFDPFDRSITLAPPIVEIPAIFEPGEVALSQGTLYVSDSDGYNSLLSFDHSAEIEGWELVSVPAGTFRAIRVRRTLDASNPAFSSVTTYWLAAGIGNVRERVEEVALIELVETNRVYLPEPDATGLRIAAAGVLVSLTVRPRQRTAHGDFRASSGDSASLLSPSASTFRRGGAEARAGAR